MKKICLILVLSILTTSSCVASVLEPGYTLGSTSSPEYSPQDRKSHYQVEPRTIAPYTPVTMLPQNASYSNASLVEQWISFSVGDYLKPVSVDFELVSTDKFLAIDGAAQASFRVNFTISYPNGTLATPVPITTLAVSPMHFETVTPPVGKWKITATLIDAGDTTAWIQAVSYQKGTKLVTAREKEKLSLVSGQALYLKIPLGATKDWFYLYVDRLEGAVPGGNIMIELRTEENYGASQSYTDYVSEFFSSKSHVAGMYLLSIRNTDRADVLVEIIKPQGVDHKMSLDAGITVTARYNVDLEFFNITVDQPNNWIAFDGAVLSESMTASYFLVDPDLDVVFQPYPYYYYYYYYSHSSSPSDFFEYLIPNPEIGTYVLAVFLQHSVLGRFANSTAKLTSSRSLPLVAGTQRDLKYIFAESGQTSYLNISLFKGYFVFAGTALSQNKVMYTIRDPDLNTIWSPPEPTTDLGFSRPITPTEPFYILKIQGQTNSSSLVHVRFAGQEDYSIQTPDASNYWSRFQGDLISANITVRTSSYFLQHSGAFVGNVYVALFDGAYNEKWSRTFYSVFEPGFSKWRRGIEDLPVGEWLQIVIYCGTQAQGEIKMLEISSLQSGDESKSVMTPFQFVETVDWSSWWQLRTYKVNIGTPRWFGIVSQILALNETYLPHPSASMWVYDSSMEELVSWQTLPRDDWYQRFMFEKNFWTYPKAGTWLVVIASFQHSAVDPLNLSISFVGETDFHQDWPANLTGTTNSFSVTVRDKTFVIQAKSNSTVPANSFAFNELNQEITYRVSGSPGTMGFSVVTIPKELAKRKFSVLIDGQPQSGVLSIENSTHTAIFFSYEHSDHQIKIIYSTPGRVKLTVKSYPSPHGSPNPSYGEHWYDGGAEVTATVSNVTDEALGVRYRCTGWNGTGVVPQGGQGTFITFSLNQHSSITWNWRAQYQLRVATDPAGLSPIPSVSPTGSWFDDDTLVSLVAQSIPGYEFEHWTLDGIKQRVGDNSLYVQMDAPHTAVAHYELGSGNLQIYVKDEKTGNAISGAVVKSLSQPSNQTALSSTTSSYGYAVFYGVKVGTYNIEVSKSGYVTDSIWINVTQYQTATGTIYLLQGKNILKVYVQDSNGSPINGTRVVSIEQPYSQPVLNGTSDATGLVPFKDIKLGSYIIQASKLGYVTNKKKVALTADQVVTMNITLLRFDETGNMTVRVTDLDQGTAISEALVASESQPEFQFPLSGITDSSGYVKFANIAPGSYIIHVSKYGYRPAAEAVNILVQKTVTLSVTLEWDIIEPLVSVTISPSNPDTTQSVTFLITAQDDEGGSGLGSVTLFVDEAIAMEWTEAGTFDYIGGPYLKGNHTYNAVAIDQAGNEARDPRAGEYLFPVVEPPASPLWTWLVAASIGTLSILGAALAGRRLRKNRMPMQA